MKTICAGIFLATIVVVEAADPSPAAPAPAGASVATATTNAPKIQFASTIFDFGTSSNGNPVRADFVFTNTGNATLEIIDVKPSCGCTTAGAWDKRVEPGQTGKIPLQLNVASYGGTVIKTATVTCNDSKQPTVVLQIKGEIWKPIDVAPNVVVFNPANPQTNEVRVVRVTNRTGQPLEITDLQSGNPSFAATLKEVTPGKEFEIVIATVPPLKIGNVQGAITAKSSSTNLPNIMITAIAMVPQPVVVTPAQLMVQSGPLAKAAQYDVTIWNNQTAPIALSDPTVSLTNVTVQVGERQTGHVFNVALKFPAGFQLPPGQRAELKINTSDPQVPVVTVPFYPAPVTAPAPAAAPTK
ncbi:MAG: DUF1573 domain-containing protein [Verrucomicrobia bacterium]|nr:DUF1573 domain-containing protein [Verrucomicrobiota bacterium]